MLYYRGLCCFCWLPSDCLSAVDCMHYNVQTGCLFHAQFALHVSFFFIFSQPQRSFLSSQGLKNTLYSYFFVQFEQTRFILIQDFTSARRQVSLFGQGRMSHFPISALQDKPVIPVAVKNTRGVSQVTLK